MKEAVEALEGRVEVHSEPEGGTAVTLHFPAAAVMTVHAGGVTRAAA